MQSYNVNVESRRWGGLGSTLDAWGGSRSVEGGRLG